jgi:hypothetical protein
VAKVHYKSRLAQFGESESFTPMSIYIVPDSCKMTIHRTPVLLQMLIKV